MTLLKTMPVRTAGSTLDLLFFRHHAHTGAAPPFLSARAVTQSDPLPKGTRDPHLFPCVRLTSADHICTATPYCIHNNVISTIELRSSKSRFRQKVISRVRARYRSSPFPFPNSVQNLSRSRKVWNSCVQDSNFAISFCVGSSFSFLSFLE